MKISERTIKRLAEIVTGDKCLSAYRGGPKLVSFFNELGTNHTYGPGFPSRWAFAEDCIRQFNDTPTLRKIILSTLDPRDFMGATVFDKETQQNKPANLQDALTYLNEFLAYDGYEIVPHGKGYDVVDKTRGEIVVDVKLEPSHLSHGFIVEQIEKCRTKITRGTMMAPSRMHVPSPRPSSRQSKRNAIQLPFQCERARASREHDQQLHLWVGDLARDEDANCAGLGKCVPQCAALHQTEILVIELDGHRRWGRRQMPQTDARQRISYQTADVAGSR